MFLLGPPRPGSTGSLTEGPAAPDYAGTDSYLTVARLYGSAGFHTLAHLDLKSIVRRALVPQKG